jgi:hypothetical protein
MATRREKRRLAKLAKKLAAPQQQFAPEPQPEPVAPPRQKRAFKARSLPLAGGVDVRITGKEAFEEDVVVRYEDDLVIIATGEAAAAIRASRNPMAALVPERSVSFVPREPLVSEPRPARRGNAATFVSSSKISASAPEEPDPEDNVVPMQQENGMPRAPRDRTGAQRRALIVNDDKGNPALAVDPEKLASMKGAAIVP